MKIRMLPAIVLSIALVGPAMLQGCSTHQETTTRETTVNNGDSDTPPSTTTTTTTTSDEPDSVLGATFHAVGTIILLPFRLVGDAISLIV